MTLFKSFICLEFTFVHGISWWLSFFFLHVAVQISQHHLLKRLLLLHFMLLPLYRILIDHRDLSLFLGSLFCSIVYVPVFMPVPGCFDYSGLVIQFNIRYCDSFYFVLLSQNCCGYSGSFMVPYKFLKPMHPGVLSSTIYNSQVLEAT